MLEGLLSVAVPEHHLPDTFGLALQPLDPLDSQVSGVTSLVDDYHVGEKEGGLHPDNPALLAEQATSLLVHSSPEIKQVGLHLGFQPGYTLLLAFHLLNFSLWGRYVDRRTLCYFGNVIIVSFLFLLLFIH